MPLHTRRAFLGSVSGALVVAAGCLGASDGDGDSDGDTSTPTGTPGSCTALDPPNPTDAAADPRSYPERPSDLTRESVRSFVESYERTYQYNEMVAEYPEKIGRLNSVDVSVNDVSVSDEDGAFSVTVSGQTNTGIAADESTSTPATPTQTPLPMGHWPFEVSYLVSDRRLRREGAVYECW